MERITLTPNEMFPDANGWKRRHMTEVLRQRPVPLMFAAIESYCADYAERYKSVVGDDYVLGPAVFDLVRGLRILLNGECGGLDCGTVDGALCKLVEVHNLGEL